MGYLELLVRVEDWALGPVAEQLVGFAPEEPMWEPLAASGLVELAGGSVEVYFTRPRFTTGTGPAPEPTVAVTPDNRFWWLDPPYGSLHPGSEIRVTDLQRAADLGLVQFDNGTILVLRPVPAHLQQGLQEVIDFLRGVGDVGRGMVVLSGALKWILRKLRIARRDNRSVENHIAWLERLLVARNDDWASRGAFVADVLQMIVNQRTWDTAEPPRVS